MTETQLTKDDVDCRDLIGTLTLDFSKFLEVREFYEKYKDSFNAFTNSKDSQTSEGKKIVKLFLDFIETKEGSEREYSGRAYAKYWKDWLFSHCFVDGLK